MNLKQRTVCKPKPKKDICLSRIPYTMDLECTLTLLASGLQTFPGDCRPMSTVSVPYPSSAPAHIRQNIRKLVRPIIARSDNARFTQSLRIIGESCCKRKRCLMCALPGLGDWPVEIDIYCGPICRLQELRGQNWMPSPVTSLMRGTPFSGGCEERPASKLAILMCSIAMSSSALAYMLARGTDKDLFALKQSWYLGLMDC